MKDYSKPKMPWHTIIFLIWLGLGAMSYLGQVSSIIEASKIAPSLTIIALLYILLGLCRIGLIIAWSTAKKFSRNASIILLSVECVISISISLYVGDSAAYSSLIAFLVPVAWIIYLLNNKGVRTYLSLTEPQEEAPDFEDDDEVDEDGLEEDG